MLGFSNQFQGLFGPLLDTQNIFLVGVDDEVFGEDPRHQHVGLDTTIGIGLPRQLAIRRKGAFGIFETGVTHPCDEERQREDTPKAEINLGRDTEVLHARAR